MKNWYCKPASEAEAIEIVERAVANGAEAQDFVKGMDFGARQWTLSTLRYWGVINNHIFGFDFSMWVAEQLTIQQVREQFPLPHEVKDMSDKKEWRGMQDGWPPIGTVCSVFHRAQSETKPSLKICRIIELLPHRKIGDRTIASESVVYLIDDETCIEVGIVGADSFFALSTER